MDVHVISIEARIFPNEYDVVVIIGEEQHHFCFNVEEVPIGSEKIIIVKGDMEFSKVFKFSGERSLGIYKLVRSIYDGHHIELPIDLGVF